MLIIYGSHYSSNEQVLRHFSLQSILTHNMSYIKY